MRDRKYRDAEGAIVIDGPRSLATAVQCGAEIEEIFVRENEYQRFSHLYSLETQVSEVDVRSFDSLADSTTPQGVLAIARRVDAAFDSLAQEHRVVVMDAIQDPGNVGAIIRTAAAAGFGAVVGCVGTADLWSPRSVRASAGTIFSLTVHRQADLVEVLESVAEAGHTRVVTLASGTTPLDELKVQERMTLILGSEAHGVSDEAIERSELKVAVPMAHPVESLNVSVTAGIVMYQMSGSFNGR